MSFIRNLSKKSNILLLLYILISVLELYYTNNGGHTENIIVRIFSHMFLFLFYISLTNKPNLIIILFILMAMFAEFFFTFDYNSTVAIVFIYTYRMLFVWEILKKKKVNSKSFKSYYDNYLLLILLLVDFVVLYINNNGTLYFYISIVGLTLLFILLFFSFKQLLNTFKEGSLELFIGIILFLFSDIVFGGFRLLENENRFFIFEHLLYNIAYLFILIADVKSHEKLYS